MRFAEGPESLARREVAARAAGGRSGIFAEPGDTARAPASWDEGEGDVGQKETVLLVSRSDDVGRRSASGGGKRTALETTEPRDDGERMRAVCDSPRHARAIIRASGAPGGLPNV